jgi:ubiquinone/menaquinone biosynthesis C-methylase UbiE
MDFDDIVHQYDDWFKTPLGAYVDHWEKEITWRLAKPQSGERVLDIGTGTANYLLELARMGLDCTGLDIGAKMIWRAHEKSEREGLPLKLLMAESASLPFPERYFDLVLSVTAFEFFPDPASAVTEMVLVCRPGGRIVISVLNNWSPWAVRRRVLTWFKETIFTRCQFYSYPQLRRLLGTMTWGTSVFAPPATPACLIPIFEVLEPLFQKAAKPFGAYLVVRKEA